MVVMIISEGEPARQDRGESGERYNSANQSH
jgi:hypothetical protein